MEVIAESLGIDTDKGLIGADYQNELREFAEIDLQTAACSNIKETCSEKFVKWLKSTRRLVETVIYPTGLKMRFLTAHLASNLKRSSIEKSRCSYDYTCNFSQSERFNFLQSEC